MNTAHRVLDVAEQLEMFLRENYQIRPDDPNFSRCVDLWDEGFVDSTGVIEVIAFLEQLLDVMLPESVLFSPRFRSIDGICELVCEL